MNKFRVFLFFSGIVIQFAALLGEHATEIPLLLKWVAPSYYDASVGIQKLERGQELTTNDVGIRVIGKMMVKAYLDGVVTNWTGPIPKDLTDSLFVSKLSTSSSGHFGPEPVGVQLKISFESKINRIPVGDKAYHFEPPGLNVLKAQVEELKQPNILYFCFGLFIIGTIAEVIAFFLEASESNETKTVADK